MIRKVFLSLILISVSLSANQTRQKFGCKKKQPSIEQEQPSINVNPPAPIPSIPCPAKSRFSGDFLYWLPTFDDTYFVIDVTNGSSLPIGQRINNDFSFKPGFRVGAEYALCKTQRELQISYSYLEGSQEKTVSGTNLWATLSGTAVSSGFGNYSGTASSHLSCLFQSVDGNFSQQILNCYGIHFYLQPGLEYAYLRLHEDHDYQNTTNLATIDQKSKVWGLGPQIGLGLDYNFYEGKFTCTTKQIISITSLFTGGILMGRAKTDTTQISTGITRIDIHDESTWRVISALHARVGFNYQIQGSRCSGSLGIGYEFNTYIRALARTIFTEEIVPPGGFTSPGSSNNPCLTSYYDFDLQGLYLSTALSF